jgi:hypothetical protein
MVRVIGFIAVVTAAVTGCAKHDDTPRERWAAGTFIGTHTLAAGPGDCTFAGTNGVFLDDSGAPTSTAEKGPRFVAATGRVTKQCPSAKTEYAAVLATDIQIKGANTLKPGQSEAYAGLLMANGRELLGEPMTVLKLDADCAGIVELESRTRTVSAKAPGTCTLQLSAMIGTPLVKSFKSQMLHASKRITIQ